MKIKGQLNMHMSRTTLCRQASDINSSIYGMLRFGISTGSNLGSSPRSNFGRNNALPALSGINSLMLIASGISGISNGLISKLGQLILRLSANLLTESLMLSIVVLLPVRLFIRTFCRSLGSPDHIITHVGCRALVPGLLAPNLTWWSLHLPQY